MATIRSCNIPDDLYYLVEKHVWARKAGDLIEVGLTDVAQNLAKGIISVTPKKVGRTLRAEQSVATVESGKWVGPVKSPIGGEVVAVNDAVSASPKSINADPYGNGWLVKMKPANWDADAASLVTGDAAMKAFEAKMTADGFAGC